MSKDRSKDRDKNWKDKLRLSQKENKRLRGRLKELACSRDLWREKYKGLRLRSAKLDLRLGGERARGHLYSLFVVELCVRICQYGGSSLRGCQHSLKCLLLVLGIRTVCPSHVSVRNWVLKHGYHRWQARGAASAGAGEWALIMDESVSVGAERLLVVLGLNLSDWKFERPPRVEDMEVLHLEVRAEWKGEDVAGVLRQVGTSHRVAQLLSDCGTNLLKASELSGYLHFSDCSHVLASTLKRHLAGREDFKAFGHLTGELRRHWTTSQYAQWRPPRLRGKSRFMNIFPLVKWAEKVLKQGTLLPEQVLQKTEWLRQNRGFVEDMGDLMRLASGIMSLLKTQGASVRSLQKAAQVIKQSASELVQAISADIKSYLQKLEAKLPGERHAFLCCSDIIETVFGKFKCRLNPQARSGITDLALIIPHFCGKTSTEQIRAALENVQNQQVRNWKNEQGKNVPKNTNNGEKK